MTGIGSSTGQPFVGPEQGANREGGAAAAGTIVEMAPEEQLAIVLENSGVSRADERAIGGEEECASDLREIDVVLVEVRAADFAAEARFVLFRQRHRAMPRDD